MKVQALLRNDLRSMHTIAGHRSVDDAITLMTEKKVSALLVMDT